MLAVLEMLERNDKKMFNEGKREGKREGKKEIIKAMINENIPMDVIEKITKFTKKEIENLK